MSRQRPRSRIQLTIMKAPNERSLPTPTAADVVHGVVKGALSGIPIPIAGGVAAEVFGIVLAPPLAKHDAGTLENRFSLSFGLSRHSVLNFLNSFRRVLAQQEIGRSH